MTLATGAAASQGTGGLSILILALPILLLAWLMFSQRRRTKALGEAQGALQVGQEVLTTSGIHGLVSALEGEVVRDDPPLSAHELDRCSSVLTTCAVAIAETGTVVLDGSADPG